MDSPSRADVIAAPNAPAARNRAGATLPLPIRIRVRPATHEFLPGCADLVRPPRFSSPAWRRGRGGAQLHTGVVRVPDIAVMYQACLVRIRYARDGESGLFTPAAGNDGQGKMH